MKDKSLKAESLEQLQIKLTKELSKAHKLEDTDNIVNSYLTQIDDIFRHMQSDVKCVKNSMGEGFIFVAWIEQDDLKTALLRFE